MTSFGYNGKNYIFNIPKICEFFMYSDSTEFKEKEVTDGYEMGDEVENSGLLLVSKIVRETRVPGNGTIDNIKYDFIKLLISQVMNATDADLHAPGFIITIETLIHDKFLIEYDNNGR